MLFAAAVSALSIVSAVSAQSIIAVQVGATATAPGGVFQFNPSNVTAKKGDIVSFQFSGNPGNHSVTQSSFADPCNPLAGGFDSGNIFVNVTEPVTPTFNVTITDDTKPIWFFCKQLMPSPHCGHGMVGAINPPASGNTFDKFQSAAMTNGTDPTKVGQAQGGLVGVGASASVGVQSQPAITIFTGAAPSATAPAGNGNGNGNGTASSSTPSKTPGAATDVAVSSITVFISAILGAFFL